jgi:P27 family predicted phage terminase small subunit
MGRPAKTIRQHLLTGTLPQAKPEQPSKFAGGRPKIPGHLSKAARPEFKRVCRILEERGTVTPGDFSVLTVYAEVYARWIAAKRELGENPQFNIITQVTDNNGTLRTVTRPNPLVRVVADLENRCLSLQRSLGLTPDSREKIKQTGFNGEAEVIPGSIADLYPDLVKELK